MPKLARCSRAAIQAPPERLDAVFALVHQPQVHLRVADIEVTQRREEGVIGLLDHGHVHVVEAPSAALGGLVRHPHAEREVLHIRHGPATPGAVAPVVAQQRLIRHGLPDLVQLGGMPRDLALEVQPRPEREVIRLRARRQVDQLPRHVELDRQVIRRHHFEDALYLVVRALQIRLVYLPATRRGQ